MGLTIFLNKASQKLKATTRSNTSIDDVNWTTFGGRREALIRVPVEVGNPSLNGPDSKSGR